jgi:hypothetical protein
MSGSELPPPSPALLAQLDAMKPVRTRRPRAQLAAVALGSLAALVGLLSLFRPRVDLLSPAVLGAAAACALAFAAELWWALVPPRGQVMPLRAVAGLRVALVWLIMLAALVVAGHDLGRDPAFMPAARACLAVGSLTAVVPALLSLLVLRRAVSVAGWRLGAVVGGAAGAFGALCLELHCANAHLWHVVVAHGGAALLPIGLLAWAVRR